jgi:nitrite reductase/ring-hydroxylating ferredoxin subunit
MRRVCTVGELDVAGGMLPVTVGPRELLIVRDGDAVHAVDRACPHEGFRLDRGEVSRGVLTCPAHGWRFALPSGTCLVPGEDLRTYRVLVDGDEVLVDDDADVTPRERELAVEGLLGALELGRPGLAARRAARLGALGVQDAEIAALLGRYGGSHADGGLEPEVAAVADVLASGDGSAWPEAAAGIAERLARMPPRFGLEPATPLAWAELGPERTLAELVDEGDAEEADRVVAGMLEAAVGAETVVAGLATGTARRFRGLWPLVVLERAARLAAADPSLARSVLPAAAYGCAVTEGRALPPAGAGEDPIGACAAALWAVEEPAGSALGCALALAHAHAATWAVAVAGEEARPALAHAAAASRLFGEPGPEVPGPAPGDLPPVRAETARGFAICHAAAYAARASGSDAAKAAVARFLGRPRRERFVEEALRDPVYELL